MAAPIFPARRIFAIDLYDKRPHDERRIKTFRGSQDDPEFLNRVADEIGHIDVIIDDGSHINSHVITTFETLFPRLAPGGLYFVEDTQTSYWDACGGSSSDLNHAGTTMNYFRRLIDAPNYRQIAEVNPAYTPRSAIERSIASLSFHAELIVIAKERGTLPPSLERELWLERLSAEREHETGHGNSTNH